MQEIYLNKDATTSEIKETLKKYGVCVLQNYFTEEQALDHKLNIIKWLQSISEGLTDEGESWTPNRLPHGPRYGMMQSLISHCPEVWKIRKEMYPLFVQLWETEDLLTSLDGATVHPPTPNKGEDWPHIDQTVLDKECYQAQVILSDTTASFRCTPTSHLHTKKILKICNEENNTSNWLKFNETQIYILRKWFGEKWQLPIHTTAGSVILWNSNTIHSAKRNDQNEEINENIPFDKWRCVVYVCMRPKSHFSKRNITTIQRAAREGRTTNHWGERMFPKRPGGRYPLPRIEKIEELSDNPEQLVIEYDELTRKLTALD